MICMHGVSMNEKCGDCWWMGGGRYVKGPKEKTMDDHRNTVGAALERRIARAVLERRITWAVVAVSVAYLIVRIIL